jgi:hypothetical protein
MIRYPIILVSLLILTEIISGCSTSPPNGNETVTLTTLPTTFPRPTTTTNITNCDAYTECVPAQCCHPTSCINSRYKGVCTVLCTQVCEGPIDCGAGHCGCKEGVCQVMLGPAP